MPEFKTIDLKKYSSLKIGPIVKYLEIRKEEELTLISTYAKTRKLKIHVLGECTNSYFANNLKKYLFVKLNFPQQIDYVEKESGVFVTANANVNWNTLVNESVERKLWGLENLTQIPSSVGAAPVQNIGAYGVELENVFYSAKVFDLVKRKFIIMKKSACEFSYRSSIFKKKPNRYIVLSVTFKLSKQRSPTLTYQPLNTLDASKVELADISNLVRATRGEKLPDYKTIPNCGSFFENPIVSKKVFSKLKAKFPEIPYYKSGNKYKIPVAWIIDKVLNMKGARINNIGIHEKHSLIVVNYSGLGNITELNKLINRIKVGVKKVAGIEIKQEVNYIA
jgi:UDP-N-acetylmuramate dehydrogenase